MFLPPKPKLRIYPCSWDSVGEVLCETGPWADDTVTYTYANRLRTSLSVQAPNSAPWLQAYTYDSARRFHTITSPAGTFTYGFDGIRNTLYASISLPGGAYATNSYDSCARQLLSALTNSSGTGLDYWFYSYNQANQRTNVVRLDGSYVAYSYDAAGQLIGAHATEADGVTARKNEQFGYKYDPAANLAWRTNNALWEAFNVNNLNELTTATNAGTLTVAGTTTSAATNVTVNGLTASRYGDYTFAKDGFAVTNGNNTFSAIAQDSYGRQDTNTVTVNLPATNIFTYDLNGNLRTNGNQVLDYDDENQLIAITVSNAWHSEFVYDGKFRRRIRREYTWAASSWLLTNTVYYVYDRNLVVQERDANNLPSVTYTRGPDLSQSLQGAGGIGGLLARTDHHLLTVSDPTAHAYYRADANGNITALVYSGGFLAARYLYDPFGNILSQGGPLGQFSFYRFSSEELEAVSGIYYYGYRFYGPSLQRWVNQDPIAERGGLNVFAFVGNSAINFNDRHGLSYSSGGRSYCCGGVYRSYSSYPEDCSDPCGKARRLGLDEGDSGGVVCCGGVKYPCVWSRLVVTPTPGARNAKRIIEECTIVHEKTHIPQTGACACGLYRQMTWKPDQDECEAHYAEMRCLMGARSQCGGDLDCESVVNAQLGATAERVVKRCAAANK